MTSLGGKQDITTVAQIEALLSAHHICAAVSVKLYQHDLNS